MSEAIIDLRSVCFQYQKNTPYVLKDINFSLLPGEAVAIVGSNGSGKSTLARHCNALLKPTTGEAWLAGSLSSDETKHLAIRQQIGMVFQNPDNQIVATLVEEDIAFGPENLGLSTVEIQQRVNEALEAVSLQKYRHHAPHLLSGGQKQRLALAGVLAMRPKVIVLDEATAMLDPEGRREVLHCLAALRAKGMALIMITHHMQEALQADRIVLMAEGRIVADASPRRVFSDYELISQMQLDIPLIPYLAGKLHQDGLLRDKDVFTKEEMVAALCL